MYQLVRIYPSNLAQIADAKRLKSLLNLSLPAGANIESLWSAKKASESLFEVPRKPLKVLKVGDCNRVHCLSGSSKQLTRSP